VASKQKNTLRIRGTSPEIEAAARRLRQNITPAETKVWHGNSIGNLTPDKRENP